LSTCPSAHSGLAYGSIPISTLRAADALLTTEVALGGLDRDVSPRGKLDLFQFASAAWRNLAQDDGDRRRSYPYPAKEALREEFGKVRRLNRESPKDPELIPGGRRIFTPESRTAASPNPSGRWAPGWQSLGIGIRGGGLTRFLYGVPANDPLISASAIAFLALVTWLLT
jgi:hypothetical protein